MWEPNTNEMTENKTYKTKIYKPDAWAAYNTEETTLERKGGENKFVTSIWTELLKHRNSNTLGTRHAHKIWHIFQQQQRLISSTRVYKVILLKRYTSLKHAERNVMLTPQQTTLSA